jgi:DnaK suppressor protein
VLEINQIFFMAKTKKVQKKVTTKKAAPKKTAKKAEKKAIPAKKVAVKKVVKKAPAKKAVAKKTTVKPAVKKTVKKAAVKKVVTAKKKAAPAPIAKPIAKPVAAPVKKTAAGTTNNSKIKKQTPLMEASKNNESLKTKYSEEDLKEFEYIKESLSRKNDESSDNSNSNLKLLEDGADTLEKESFSQLAARQMKFIQQLEFAIARIKNGTYGVCIETGKLIPKERLRAVPHTQHSIEAKLNRR